MEDLTEVQGVWAVIDLDHSTSRSDRFDQNEIRRTMSKPVTFTTMLGMVGEDGCASSVVTWCCTFANLEESSLV